jgi:hypothetical protein
MEIDRTRDRTMFADVAQQCGFHVSRAYATLDVMEARLRDHGHADNSRFYIFRSEPGGAGQASESKRTRRVVAFATADEALAFAQYNNMHATPRLSCMSVAQLLAVMVQHDDIDMIIFADEAPERAKRGHLPVGLRLEREMVLSMLRGE